MGFGGVDPIDHAWCWIKLTRAPLSMKCLMRAKAANCRNEVQCFNIHQAYLSQLMRTETRLRSLTPRPCQKRCESALPRFKVDQRHHPPSHPSTLTYTYPHKRTTNL